MEVRAAEDFFVAFPLVGAAYPLGRARAGDLAARAIRMKFAGRRAAARTHRAPRSHNVVLHAAHRRNSAMRSELDVAASDAARFQSWIRERQYPSDCAATTGFFFSVLSFVSGSFRAR